MEFSEISEEILAPSTPPQSKKSKRHRKQGEVVTIVKAKTSRLAPGLYFIQGQEGMDMLNTLLGYPVDHLVEEEGFISVKEPTVLVTETLLKEQDDKLDLVKTVEPKTAEPKTARPKTASQICKCWQIVHHCPFCRTDSDATIRSMSCSIHEYSEAQSIVCSFCHR